MSHSKMTKRGSSLYVDSWNPRAKNFITTCSLCGSQGYSPTIEEEGFCDDFERRAIYYELKQILKPQAIDELGRCETCAKIHDKNL